MKETFSLNDGLAIPKIGFGTWHIVPNGRAKEAVLNALDAGYRLIDTAKIYGNEKGVGEAIRESSLLRKDVFVATKLWNGDQGYDKALKAFDMSLRMLGMDYVDLYLIHWPIPGKRLDSWRALEEIYKSGRAKAVGVSNFTIKHLKELAQHSNLVPAVNQIEFHPYLYETQAPLVEYCREKRILVEAYSPLAHGKKFRNDETLNDIASNYGKTSAQIILRWCIQHGTLPLPKSSNPEHIHENLDIFDFKLTEDEMSQINDLSEGLRTCWNPEDLE